MSVSNLSKYDVDLLKLLTDYKLDEILRYKRPVGANPLRDTSEIC